jgi:hypothetical protein
MTLKKQLSDHHKHEEILWKKKYQVHWLKEGGNKNFFHRSMIHKRYINHITKLKHSHGNTLLDHADIEEELVTYYKELLSETPFDITPSICRIIQHIPTLIIPEQNKSLMRPIL